DGNAGHDGANMNNKAAAGYKKNQEKQAAPDDGQHHGQKTGPVIWRRRFVKGHWSFLQSSFYGIMSQTPKPTDSCPWACETIMQYRNLVEVLRKQANRLGPKTALRFKRYGIYHDLSWEQYRADVLAAAASLLQAGIQIGDRVGLLSENRV